MTTIVLLVLFIAQLVSFACIALLNTKIAKFKMIEQNQESLMREMEDSFSVYLIEMKEENDRLIKELSVAKATEMNGSKAVERSKTATNSFEEVNTLLNRSTKHEELPKTPTITQIEQTSEPKRIVPKSIATNAYKKNHSPHSATAIVAEKVSEAKVEPVDEVLVSFEQEVVNLHKNGLSIEEIAKKTQKGKTEIELLIKFHA
jgi:hypothetical protein